MQIYNKAFIAGRIYDVIDFNTDSILNYNGDALAVRIDKYVLPVRYNQEFNQNSKPGIYIINNWSCIYPLYPRTPYEEDVYSINHLAYLSTAETFKDIVAAKEQLDRDQYNHLVTSDKVFTPSIDDVNDTPLIKGLKMAVCAKQCDINRYSEKFGPDFNNDRRKFNGNDITAAKYASISKNLDIRTTLIIEDMNPNVANPIGKKIVLTWVGDGENDNTKESEYRNAICDNTQDDSALDSLLDSIEDDGTIDVDIF